MNGPRQVGPRIMFPDTQPGAAWPAVPPPAAALNANGPSYGIQSRREWAAGEVDERDVVDTIKGASLWRFSAFGNVTISIIYGTETSRQFLSLQAPVVMTIPGQFSARAKPRGEEGASCTIALTQATAGARAHARKLIVGPGGGGLAFDDDAVTYTALTASTLTISGVATAVPALSTVPLVTGSVLITGSGFQEFEA